MQKIQVLFTNDPSEMLREVSTFLRSRPIINNLILTLLHERIRHQVEGRYWVAKRENRILGCALQSPLHYGLNLSPMDREAVEAIVGAIVDQGIAIPEINGVLASTVAFAGKWMELHKTGVRPVQALRIYELHELKARPLAQGWLRQATAEDQILVTEWLGSFYLEIKEEIATVGSIVRQRLAEGRIWLWEDQMPVSLVVHSHPVENITRIQTAYTPVAERNKGYSSTCVSAVSELLLSKGHSVMLYTDMANPISNFVFKRIGFELKAEGLKYMLGLN